MPTKRRSELEEDLKFVLNELDVFQSKVEGSDNTEQANAALEEDLAKILSSLDDFQEKVEEADEDDINALKGLLDELQQKLMLGEEMEDSKSSPGKSIDAENRVVLKGATPEKHLELYLHSRARKGTHDLPQAILLQNFIERKRRRRSNSWFHDLLFGQEQEISTRRAELFPGQMEALKDMTGSSSRTLKVSNAKLKETIVRLENTIAQMEQTYRAEISAHQEVIQKLQKENMLLHDNVYSLKQKEEEYERVCNEIAAYKDIVKQLQKENVELHYKVEILLSHREDDPLGYPNGYLSSSLEDSYSRSPSLREMTNRVSSTSATITNPSSSPVNILKSA